MTSTELDIKLKLAAERETRDIIKLYENIVIDGFADAILNNGSAYESINRLWDERKAS